MSPEHEALAYLMQQDAWEGVYKARIREQVRILYDQLLDPAKTRANSRPDDFIRGMVVAYRDAIEWPQLEVAMARKEEEEQLEAAEEAANVVPLFGGGRPDPEGELDGRTESGSG